MLVLVLQHVKKTVNSMIEMVQPSQKKKRCGTKGEPLRKETQEGFQTTGAANTSIQQQVEQAQQTAAAAAAAAKAATPAQPTTQATGGAPKLPVRDPNLEFCQDGWELCPGIEPPPGYEIDTFIVTPDPKTKQKTLIDIGVNPLANIGLGVFGLVNLAPLILDELGQRFDPNRRPDPPDDHDYQSRAIRRLKRKKADGTYEIVNPQRLTLEMDEVLKGHLCCYDKSLYIGAKKVDFDNEPDMIPAARNPLMTETDLDLDYEDYDYNEYLEAEKEQKKLDAEFPNIKIQEPPIFDIGYAMTNMDVNTIDQIPWDYDNKDQQQKDIVWGYIPPAASKSIFMRAYAEQNLSNMANLKFDDKGKAIWKSIIAGTSVDVKDPALAKTLEVTEGMIMAIAPMLADKVQEKFASVAMPMVKGAQGALKTASNAGVNTIKSVFTKSTAMLSKSAAKIGGQVFAKKTAQQTGKSVSKSFVRMFRRLFTKTIIGSVAMLAAQTATAVAANAAAAASLGVLSFLAAIANFILSAVVWFMTKTNIFFMIAGIMLPPILDKYLAEDGACVGGAKALKSIIPQAANTLISIFVPGFGDVLDLFYPFLCCGGSGGLSFKSRLKNQPYREDTTLSAYYASGKCGTGPDVRNEDKGKDKNRDPISADDDPSGQGYNPPPLRSVCYYWCNFAHPVMMDRMAQFYYTNSLLNPFEDDDGNTCFQYIVEFYGVIASSELSCDVACRMKTICYQPFTGQNYRESYFCDPIDPDYSLREQVCYRRFYFIKVDEDPVGLFKVAACTNQNYTAPKAETASYDGGDYVPSVPKQFKANWKDPLADKGAVWSAIGANIAIGAAAAGAGMMAGRMAGRMRSGQRLLPRFKTKGKKGSFGIFGGSTKFQKNADGSRKLDEDGNPMEIEFPKPSKGRGRAALATEIGGALVGGLLPVAMMNTIQEFEKKIGAVPPDNADETMIIGNPKDGYSLVTNVEHWYIERGPVIEDSTGYKPFVYFCNVGAARQLIDPANPSLGYTQDLELPIDQCRNYLTLRDTIDYYQKQFPNRHVKEIVGIEPRRGGACYYKWKETTYNPETNVEGTALTEKEVLMPYEIRNRSSCVYEPKGIIYPKEKALIELQEKEKVRGMLTVALRIVEQAANLAPVPEYTKQNKRTAAIRRIEQQFKRVSTNADAVRAGLDKESIPLPITNLTVQTYTDYATAAAASDRAIDEIAAAFSNLKKLQADRVDASHVRGPDGQKVSMFLDSKADLENPRYGLITIVNKMTERDKEILPVNSPLRNSIIWPTRNMIRNSAGKFEPATLPKYPYKPFKVPRALPPQTTLAGDKCPANTCDNRDTIDTLVRGFNDANRSKGRQIIKVLRAWTPNEGRCDYDVEMMRIYRVDPVTKQVLDPALSQGQAAPAPRTSEHKVLQRESVRIDVREDPKEKCNFLYKSDGSDQINSGTFIQENTPDLSGADVSGGVPFYNTVVKSLKSAYNTVVAPLAQFKILEKTIDSSKRTYEASDKVVETVFTNLTLEGCPTKKCSDPDMIQMMVDYFNSNTGIKNPNFMDVYTEQYVTSIVKAGVASNNQCDIMFKVRQTLYNNILQNPTDVNDMSVRIRPLRFNVRYIGGTGDACRFGIDESRGPVFRDVSSGAIGLRYESSTLKPEYDTVPKRVDCSSPSVLNAVKASIETFLNNRDSNDKKAHNFTAVTKTFQPDPRKCQYEMKKSMVNTDKRRPFKCSNDFGQTFTKCDDYTTYVNAEFVPSTTDPNGFTLSKTVEYDPIDLTMDEISETYMVNGVPIRTYDVEDGDENKQTINEVPLMLEFDAKKSTRVDTRIYSLPAK